MIIVNGTTYHNDTPTEVISILEKARVLKNRLIITYGFPNGHPWGDNPSERGSVGRSIGPVKIPLLLKTKRSNGGEGILSHCIIMIQKSVDGKLLYQKGTI